MILRKARLENNYTRLPNEMLRNATLSWKARGLLCYLLSLPDDWTVNLKHLTTQAPDGRDSLLTGIAELRKAGYIKLQEVRSTQGKFAGVEYYVYDIPQEPDENIETAPDNDNEELTVNGLSVYGKTAHGKSAPTKYLVKEELINTNQLLLEADEKNSENQNEIAKVFKSYEAEIGFLTPYIRNDIVSFLDESVSPDWIVAAIEEASRSNIRNWKYIAAIIKRWQVEGFQTQKSKQQDKSKRRGKPQATTEFVPEHEESQTIVKGSETHFIEGKIRYTGGENDEIPF